MWPFKKKVVEVQTPLQRATNAVDELNAAIRELRMQPGYNNHKAYVTAYNPSTRQGSKVVLGYWSDRHFVIDYEKF